MTQPPRLTAEVQEALRLAGISPDPDRPPPAPAGQIRYHIAVEQTVLQGAAPPPVVAATLRELARQIETTTEENKHG